MLYDVAQICPNGHVVNSTSSKHPERNEKYCSQCGEETITTCPRCGNPIRGFYWGEVGDAEGFRSAAFCHACGKPFPWTERRIQAAIDAFVDEIGPGDDANQFAESVREVARETPKTELAAKRLVRLMGKIKGTAVDLVKKAVDAVACEVAKRIIFPH
jgi:hypothetical protein